MELNAVRVGEAVAKLARGVKAEVGLPADRWVLVGIHRRGVPLAHRLAAVLAESGLPGIPVGSLDITFYRDDMAEGPLDPVVQETDLPFDITGKVVVLVDDVLYSGRTVRCALDELMDFGRPARVLLAVLVDRGQRELPIQADVAGLTVTTSPEERVDVHLSELDGEDAVWISPARTRRGKK
jgi:pyrimidine operon attenuation protein/uracil phosphoribosyltransferase